MKPIALNEKQDKQFLYMKLYETLRDDILSGKLASGEKLSSLRQLSNELDLSLTTVSLAYNQLLVEGYVYVKPQSGYYVSDIKALGFDVESNNIYDAEEESLKSNIFIHDSGSFDFSKWKKCASSVFNNMSDQLMFESDPQGELALRYEISKYLLRARGVDAKADRIVIGAGTQQITSHLSRILQKMSIGLVSLEEPGYLPVQSMFRDAGFTLFSIPVDKDGISISKLPTNIPSAVYVSPSNQFPTGAVMPIGRRYELLSWAKDNSGYIVEDDYDSELRYFGKPVPSLQSLDKNGRVIYLGSFSSTLFPAIKISYMVLPKELAEIFKTIKNEYTQTCSKAEQLTLALYMEKGCYVTNIKKLRAVYAQKLERTVNSIAKYGKNAVVAKNTQSGISLTLSVKSGLNSDELTSRAADLGIQLVPVNQMTGIDTDTKDISTLSLYYSQLPLDDIEDLIKAMINAWEA